jgi:membrane protease YdiL (CAAX protease family)
MSTTAIVLDLREVEYESHSIPQSVALHLLPGILIGAVVFTIRGLVVRAGYPTLMALLLAIPIALIPFELGVLFLMGRRSNGRFSLDGIVYYRDPIPVWQYFVIGPLVAILMFAVLVLLQPLDAFLYNSFFSWIPTLDSGMGGDFSRATLLATYMPAIVFGAILGPITEELYFRGFLLPRMSRFGHSAPLIHALLFALYHTFTIWQFTTRTIMMLPLIYAVRRRNIYVGMIAHIMVNLFSPLLALISILQIHP